MTRLDTGILIGVGAIVLAALCVYSGIFDAAADAPHSALVYAVMIALTHSADSHERGTYRKSS